MSCSKGAPDNHGDFRDNGVRHGIHQLRARFDDAAPFRVAAYHEAVDIMKENEGDKVLVAVHDEARGFFGRLGVDDAAKLHAFVAFMIGLVGVQFLIGNDADSESANARVPADNRLAVFGFVFVEAAFVDNPRQDFFHVIGTSRRGIVDAVDFFGRHGRIDGLFAIPGRAATIAPLLYEGSDARQAGLIVGLAEVHRTADGRVHGGSTQFFSGNFLSDSGLHECGSG